MNWTERTTAAAASVALAELAGDSRTELTWLRNAHANINAAIDELTLVLSNLQHAAHTLADAIQDLEDHKESSQ